MSKTVILVSAAVIAISLYVILSPHFKEEVRVVGKIRDEPVDIHKVEIEEIRISYGGRSINLDPESPSARKLLYYVQQALPQLRVEPGNLSAFMGNEEVKALMRNSSYVLIVLKEEKPISFGELTYPCRRLVVFLDGRAAGMLGVQPAGGAMQQVAPSWEFAAMPEENLQELLSLIEEAS